MDANLSMEQIRMDVKNVTALNQEGYDMDVSSHKLDLSKDYVQTILTCAQGFTGYPKAYDGTSRGEVCS